MNMAIRADGGTHPGRVRQHNEDAFYLTRPNGTVDPAAISRAGHLFVVADGVGGNRGGARASEIAVSRLPAYYYSAANGDPARGLRLAFDSVAREIVEEAQNNPDRANMSCTIVAVVIKDGQVTVAHLGDARAYLLRGGRLQHLTRDHTWVQMQVEKGTLTEAEAENHPERNVITKSMGNPAFPEPDVNQTPLQADDRLLLCSDGLCGVANDAEITAVLSKAGDPSAAIRPLIELANRKGGPDNVTAVVVQTGRGSTGGAAVVAPAVRRSNALPVLLLVALAAVLLGGFLVLRPGGNGRAAMAATATATTEGDGLATAPPGDTAVAVVGLPTSTVASGAIVTATITTTLPALTGTPPALAVAPSPTSAPLVAVTLVQPGSLCPGDVPAVVEGNEVRFVWHSAGQAGFVVRYGTATPDTMAQGPIQQTGNLWRLVAQAAQFTPGINYRWQVYNANTGQPMGDVWCFSMPSPSTAEPRPTNTPDTPVEPSPTKPSATEIPNTPTTDPNLDSDGDGVLDVGDQCPDEPQGPSPDFGRPGCPQSAPTAISPTIAPGPTATKGTP